MNKLVKGRGVLQSIGYTGICCWKGYGFQDIYSGIGSSNNRKLVTNRVLFNGIDVREPSDTPPPKLYGTVSKPGFFVGRGGVRTSIMGTK